MNAAPPGLPFMSGAFRFKINVSDALLIQGLVKSASTLDVFRRADGNVKGAHLVVEGFGVGKDAIVCRLDVAVCACAREDAEGGKCLEVGQADHQRLTA